MNPLARGATVALLLAACGAAGPLADADFADAAGFSGRAGVTCAACHVPGPVPVPAAQAVLEGLPAAWEPGRTYALTVSVRGGPQAMPAPQPQGGFDLSVGAGRLGVPEGMGEAVRLVGDQEATYRPAGTLLRQWRVDWTAPGLQSPPADVPVWLAVLSANGNHVIATNVSDGGERLDAAASLQASVPPSPAALQAWKALPLHPPLAEASRTADGWALDGRHQDGNASRLLWRLDGGPWQARDTAATWRLQLEGLDGGHTVSLRSEGLGRASAETVLTLGGSGVLAGAGPRGAPVPPALPLLAIALAFALAARRCPP